MTAVYTKTLRLKSAAASAGEIVSLQSGDANRIMVYYRNVLFLPFTILVLMGVLVLLVFEVGVLIALTSMGLLLFIAIPPQIFTARFTESQRQKLSRVADLRLRIMGEVLGAIKLVKLYCWEKPFSDQISSIRNREMAHLRKLFVATLENLSLGTMAPILVSIYTLGLYVYFGNTFTPTKAFTIASLLDATRLPLDLATVAFKAIAGTRPPISLADLPIYPVAHLLTYDSLGRGSSGVSASRQFSCLG